jgi:xylulokinase
MLSAASALDWVGQLTGERDSQRLAAAAQARGLRRTTPYFLPYLSGERTPHNDAHARGVFFGLDSQTEPADLTLAVLEGVALAFADGMDVLLESGGVVGEISVTGGGARFGYWSQLIAAALNRPLTFRLGSEIGAAVGAARLARLAVTGESPQAVCVMPRISHVIQPARKLAALLADRRCIYARLYRDLKDAFVEFAT